MGIARRYLLNVGSEGACIVLHTPSRMVCLRVCGESCAFRARVTVTTYEMTSTTAPLLRHVENRPIVRDRKASHTPVSGPKGEVVVFYSNSHVYSTITRVVSVRRGKNGLAPRTYLRISTRFCLGHVIQIF